MPKTIERHCPACQRKRTLYPYYMPPGVLYICADCTARIHEAHRAREN